MKIWAEKATKTFSTLLMIKHILWNDFDYVTIGVFLLQIWLRWFWLCHSYWFCEFDKTDDQSRLLQHHICQIWFYQYSYDYIISIIDNHIILITKVIWKGSNIFLWKLTSNTIQNEVNKEKETWQGFHMNEMNLDRIRFQILLWKEHSENS